MKNHRILPDQTKRKGMTRFLLVLVLMIAALNLSGQAFANEYSQTIEVFRKSAAVRPFFKNAYGYAVFPIVGKGGLGVGAAFGKGRVYRSGSVTGEATLVKLSVGWQAGGQALSEIIFFEDKRAYDDFTGGSFEFDAEASAVAITAGAQAQAGTQGTTAGASAGPSEGVQIETKYQKGMAVFVHAKGGLMYEAAIAGQRFEFTPKKK